MTAQREIRVQLIDDGPNVRLERPDRGLVESIHRHGVLQPIRVRAVGRRYEVVMGFRRLTAARHLALETIPAIIEDEAPSGDRILRQLAENTHRKGMNPLDIAMALQDHLDTHPGMTKAELARALGYSKGYGPVWVANKLALLRLDGPLRDKVEAGTLSESQALQARQRLGDGRGRPRAIPLPEDGYSRARSITVPLSRPTGQHSGSADIAIDRETDSVDLTLHSADRGMFLTLTPSEAKLLGKRLQQAGEALLAVAS